MLSAPTRTAPAASMRSTSVASREDGARSRLIFEPARVGKALHVEQVFDRERHAGERADASGRPRSRHRRLRLGARAIGGDVGEGVQNGIVLCDPRQRGFGHGERGQSCRRPRPARFLRPTARRICGHGVSGCEDTGAARFRRAARNSSTSRASLSDTSRLALTAGLQASSIGSASALRDGIDIVVQGFGAISLPFRFA